MSHGFYFCLERGTTEVRELKGPQMPLGKRKPGGLRKNPSQSPVVRATRVCRGPVNWLLRGHRWALRMIFRELSFVLSKISLILRRPCSTSRTSSLAAPHRCQGASGRKNSTGECIEGESCALTGDIMEGSCVWIAALAYVYMSFALLDGCSIRLRKDAWALSS